MKKILTTLAVSGLTAAAFAQGYVNFAASPGGDIISVTNSAAYSGLSSALGAGAATGQQGGAQGVTTTANVYYYELLYSTVDTTTPTTLSDLAANWTATGLHLQNSTTANNGRLAALNGTTASAIDPSYTGGNLQVMIVGWSANLGTTFGGAGGVLSELQNWSGAIANAFFGESTVGTVALSTSSAAGSTIWTSGNYVAGGLIANPSTAPLVMNELATTPTSGRRSHSLIIRLHGTLTHRDTP